MATIIRGAANIEKTISDLLNSGTASFRSAVQGKEPKVLLVILELLNYGVGVQLIARKNGAVSLIDSNRYRAIVCLRTILDTLLSSGLDSIEHLTTQEFSELSQITIEHIDIGDLALHLRTQRTYPAEEAVLKNGFIGDTYDRALYKAIDPWVRSAGSDPEWVNWYFSNYDRHREVTGKLLESEFKNLYGLRLSDLTGIDRYFESQCKRHMNSIAMLPAPRPDDIPFLSLDRKKLMRIFSDKMNEKEARSWLKLLEYKPGEDLFKRPLIPLRLRGKWIYTLMTWVFTPMNSFWGAWIGDMLLTHPDLRARGKWAQGYGQVFELYVDQAIRERKVLVANHGKRKIEASFNPEIGPWLPKLDKKHGFEVDRFIQVGDVLFVVSCKARDFLYDTKISQRDFFFPIPEIEARIEQNIEFMNEIQTEAECVASFPSIRRRLGLGGSILVPVVVTSRLEPMGVIDIRSYYSSKLPFPPVPMLKVGDFVEILKEPSKWISNGSLPHI